MPRFVTITTDDNTKKMVNIDHIIDISINTSDKYDKHKRCIAMITLSSRSTRVMYSLPNKLIYSHDKIQTKRMFKNKLDKILDEITGESTLINEMNEMKREIEGLKDQIMYMPGGQKYNDAETHFNSLKNNT